MATRKKNTTAKKTGPEAKKADSQKKEAPKKRAPSSNAHPGAAWAAVFMLSKIERWREAFKWEENEPQKMVDRLIRKKSEDRIRNRETPQDLVKLIKKQAGAANKLQSKSETSWKLFERSLTKTKPLPSMLELAAFVNANSPVVLLVRIPNERLAARFETELKAELFLPVVARRMESYLVQPAPTLAPLTLTTSELLACWHGGSPTDLGPWTYGGRRWMIALHQGKQSPHVVEDSQEEDIDGLLDAEIEEKPAID